MGAARGPSLRLGRNLLLTTLLASLLIGQFCAIVVCWVARPNGRGQHVLLRVHSSAIWKRKKWHSKQPPLKTASVGKVNASFLGSGAPGEATEGDALGTDSRSEGEVEIATPTSDMQIAMHAAIHQVTSSELQRLLESRGWAPRGETDRASLARSLRAVLDTELEALQDTEGEPGHISGSSSCSHKQKLRDRLEALRRQATAGLPSEDGSADCPVRRCAGALDTPGSQPAQSRRYSWDSEHYSVTELLRASADGSTNGAESLPEIADIVKLRDQVLRELVSLPALLTAGELDAAARQLPKVSASATKEALFRGRRNVMNNKPLCARRQYGLPDLLKDLRTTCTALRDSCGHSNVGEAVTDLAAPLQTAGVLASGRPHPLSLFSLFTDLADTEDLAGMVYCTRLDGTTDPTSSDKRSAVVLLPGKLKPRSLVVVPELAPAGPPSSSPEGRVDRNVEGRLAAARLLSHGLHGLIARTLLWLHLHERAEALAIVGLADGGAEALRFAAKLTPASQATVALPFAAEQEANSRVFQSPLEMPAPKPRSLPHLDTVIALYPSEFGVDAVAATLTAPTLALFEEPTQEPQLVRVPHGGASSAAFHARAAALDKALRKHAQTRDHCVQTALRGSACSSSNFGELVEEDVLLMVTSWLNLWMGRQVPEHIEAVPDVSGFELSFRRFQSETCASARSFTTTDDNPDGCSGTDK